MKSNIPDGISQDMINSLFHRSDDDNQTTVTLTCAAYCEYYRGNEGEKGCGGLAAVRKGVATGKIGPVQISYLLDLKPGPARRSGCLINELCSRCSYFEDGCDFMSPSPPPDATPCGGYRILQTLLNEGALTPGVVRMLIQDT